MGRTVIDNEIKALIKQYSEKGIKLWTEEGKLKFKAPANALTAAMKAELKEKKERIIAYLLDSAKLLHDEEGRYEAFPLTDIQAAYLVGRTGEYSYGGVGCKVYLEMTAHEIDHTKLQEAWGKVVNRHDMTHAAVYRNGTQCVCREYTVPEIQFYDFTGMDSEEQAEKAAQIRRELSGKQYKADAVPLYDLALVKLADRDLICFSIDMLIADFTSITIMVNELEAFYYGEGEPGALEITFRDVLMNRQENKDAQKAERAKKYWMDRIETIPEAPAMPVEESTDALSTEFEQHNFVLGYDKWDAVTEKAKSYGLTPTSIVLNAYANVIGRWSGQKQFSLNVTMANRENVHSDIKNIVGDFTIVDILEVNLDSKKTFAQQSDSIQKQLWSDMENVDFSGVAVMRELKRAKERDVLFPVVFTSTLGFRDEKMAVKERKFVLTYKISQTPQVLIDCQISEESTGILINWDVRKGAFPEGVIEDAFSAFTAELEALTAEESSWDSCRTYALSEKSAEIRRKVNATEGTIPEGLLYDGFIRTVGKMPEKTALIAKDREYSYRELADCAVAIQKRLSGIEKGEIVAVDLGKSMWQIASVLGILLAGGVYLPLDAGQPAERKNEIIKGSGAKWVVTDTECKITEEVNKVLVPDFHDVEKNADVNPIRVDADTLAYIIYTSGSTGKPKGVMITHKAALNTVVDINERFHVTENDRGIALANLAFDLSVYDIFGMFTAGASLVVPDQVRSKAPQHWEELIDKYSVTVWNSVPAQMQMLTMYLGSMKEKKDYALRLIMLSGDWIPVAQPEFIYSLFGDCMLISLGGATEAAIWSIYYPIERGHTYKRSIPYGIPLKNQYFRVLNENLEDCPDWVTGDLYIGGIGLTLGYFKDSETTAAKLITHPVTGETLYFTGDLGRYHSDGVIEFMGRSDNQLKIHGHRIEIKEIESSLESIPQVEAAVVVIDQTEHHEKSLAAFVQPVRDKKLRKTCVPGDVLGQAVVSVGDKGTENIDRELYAKWTAIANETAVYDIYNCFKKQGIFVDDTEFSVEEAEVKFGRHPYYEELFRRWLSVLCKEGMIQFNPETEKYSRLNTEVTEETSKQSWAKWWAIENEIQYGKRLLEYFEESSRNLLAVMRGEIDELDLFFPRGDSEIAMAAYHDNIISQSLNKVMVGAVLAIMDEREKAEGTGHTFRILEIGAGVGGVTLDMIPAINGRNVEYVFTDVSQFFLNKAQENFAAYPFMEYGLFDINKPYWKQGVKNSEFDIIICNNVLHNAKSLPHVMQSFREILVEGGAVIIADTTGENYSLLTSMEFHAGLNQFEDFRKEENQVFVKREQWLKVFEEENIELAAVYPSAEDTLAVSRQAVFVGQFVSSAWTVTADSIKAELAKKVPEYMIPKYVEVLSYLPLTQNGKIDRNLLMERLEYINPFVAESGTQTQGELEKRIEAIWANALNREQVWRDENFYQAGGDSLLLAQIVSEMKEQIPEYENWEWDVLMSEIIQSPTIAGIAEKAGKNNGDGSDGVAQKQPNMVIIDEKKGSKSCIVFFHEGTGTLTRYDEMLPYIKADPQRKDWMIGFQCGDETDYLGYTTETLLGGLGRKYADMLLEQGFEEYTLVGFCMGGLIATEAAKCLIEAGKHVKPVVVIDTAPQDYRLSNSLLMERAFGLIIGADMEKCGHDIEEDLLKEALFHLLDTNDRVITEEDLCSLDGTFSEVGACFRKLAAMDAKERFLSLCSNINRLDGAHISEFQQEKVDILYKVFCLSFSAVALYEQQNEFFTGDVVVLDCKDKASNFLPVRPERTSEFWHEIVLGNLEVIKVEGDHFSCIQEPGVKDVADIISRLARG